jgi:hypothetical protein
MDPKILTILRMSGLERVADLIESDGLTLRDPLRIGDPSSILGATL